VIAEVTFSMIYQIMSLTSKDMGGCIGYPTRPSQSKRNSSGLEGRVLGESKTLSHSEGAVSEMPTTWLKDASPSKGRVGLTKNCIDTTTSSNIG